MKEEALKLADELDMLFPSGIALIGGQASAMIRRLVEELDKQGEPVAWTWFSSVENKSPYTQMTGYTTECWSWNKPDESVKVDEGTLIPLYTTPQTKPLSDEGIKEVIRKHWNREYGNRDMLTLCRAIEERHGIK